MTTFCMISDTVHNNIVYAFLLPVYCEMRYVLHENSKYICQGVKCLRRVRHTKKAETNIRPKYSSVSRRGSITNQPELVRQDVIKKGTSFSEYNRNRRIVFQVLIKKMQSGSR
jgi:hypothetical protein